MGAWTKRICSRSLAIGGKQRLHNFVLTTCLLVPDLSQPRLCCLCPLQLGNTSMQQKSLEGINSMMRSQAGPGPMATPASRAYNHPPLPSTSYRRLNTPIKLDPSPVQGKLPGTAGGNKRQLPASASNEIARKGKLARANGKENAGTPGQKRSPCNCKKSRCLKLYCECFAAELFCDGCNCTDCQNTSAFVS